MGPLGLRPSSGVAVGPVKVLLDDDALPALPELVATIVAAHEEDRAVAFHCVTRTQAVLIVVALHEAGSNGRDRIEHGAVLPDELLDDIAALRLTVVTQPSFVAERGETYAQDVDADDVPHLYRVRSLLDRGIGVLGGSDAPYASLDPWAAMRAAMTRTIGAGERVDEHTARALFTSDHTLEPSAPADVVVRDDRGVRTTIAAGRVLFSRD
jgi:predicted amidohydrolase YtcJ